MTTHVVFPDEKIKCTKIEAMGWDCAVVNGKTNRETKKTFSPSLFINLGTGISRHYEGNVHYIEPTGGRRAMECKNDPIEFSCKLSY